MTDRKLFLAKIIIGCCLLQSAVLGLFYNTFGIYTAAICNELNFLTAQFMVCWTLQGLVSAFLLPVAGKILNRYFIKKIVVLASVVLCAAQAMMFWYNHLWQFYVSGFLFGISGSILFSLPVPLVINSWFDEKQASIMLGIASASSGVSGVVFSKMIGYFIEQYSWRECCVLSAGVCLLMCMMAAVLLQDCDSYNVEKSDQNLSQKTNAGHLIKKLVKDPRFFFMVMIYLAGSSGVAFGNHISNHAMMIGFGIAISSTMNSSLMLGNLSGKLIAGFVSSKIGEMKTLYVLASICALGFSFLTGTRVNSILIGSCLAGISYSLITVITPMLVKRVFKGYNYIEVLSIFSMLDNLTRSLMSIFYGGILDWLGSYAVALYICIALLGLCLISALTLEKCFVKKNE